MKYKDVLKGKLFKILEVDQDDTLVANRFLKLTYYSIQLETHNKFTHSELNDFNCDLIDFDSVSQFEREFIEELIKLD